MSFRSLLIANRGEIACRIMRTAKRMGIRCLAVFSEADRQALHVAMADCAYPIGAAPPSESYLRIERIIDAATALGAEAIHPGYGFLAENAAFAEACTAAGLIFVGPPARAIRLMGSKAEAKALMHAAGLPVVPAYHGEDQSDARLAAEAERIGFPLLIKASAGGGGKGMRAVATAASFADALAAARREAQAAFGDDRVVLERLLVRPRHVEVQILADRTGHTIHLHSRDCSLQRRYQKILEEAPAPALSSPLREALHAAAIRAARAVDYVNAGTVEFLLEDEAFYFLEMNTRLQVEHPVTEMITGIDLVEWQLRVAAGESLPWRDAPPRRGHALEVRLCAEDPAADFRPATGVVSGLRPPPTDPAIRFDSGVRCGDIITPYYDPMIAKVIASGDDRGTALRRLCWALDEMAITGVHTNLSFLRRLLRHPALIAGAIDTDFLTRSASDLLAPPQGVPQAVLIAAAVLSDEGHRAAARPVSPWEALTGFRLFGTSDELILLSDGHHLYQVTLQRQPTASAGTATAGMIAIVDGGRPFNVSLRQAETVQIALDGVWHRLGFTQEGPRLTLVFAGETYLLQRLDPYAPRYGEATAEGRLTAPLPGRVVQLFVSPGERIRRGQLVAILEAMKTEFRLLAPADGRVVRLGCAVGESIAEGTELIVLAPADEDNAAASPPVADGATSRRDETPRPPP